MNYAQRPEQSHEDATAAAPAHGEQQGADFTQWSILERIQELRSGDEQVLVSVLRKHPEMRDQIVARATKSMGNESVARALEMMADKKPVGGGTKHLVDMGMDPNKLDEVTPAAAKQPKVDSGEPMGGGTKHLVDMGMDPNKLDEVTPTAAKDEQPKVDYGKPMGGGTRHLEEMGMDPNKLDEVTPAAAKQEPKVDYGKPMGGGTRHLEEMGMDPNKLDEVTPTAEKQESSWVTGARAFNRRHSQQVAEFNQLTFRSCEGSNGELDPNLVAQWQQDHGVAPDGRVGKATVAAAREGEARGSTETGGETSADDVREEKPANRPHGLDTI